MELSLMLIEQIMVMVIMALAGFLAAKAGVITGKDAGEILSCQNTGNQSGGSAAVAGVQCGIRSRQTVQAFAVYKDPFRCILNLDSHFAKTADR